VLSRLREHKLDASGALRDLPLEGKSVRLGPFTVEAIPVSHSIPQAAMIALHTPAGTVVHTADFKLDPNPPNGAGTDLGRLARIGDSGVLAVLSDSTNAEQAGFTPGERTLHDAFDSLLSTAPGRVFVTTFASNVARMQIVSAIAREHGRKVALVGSSMLSHAAVASSLGLLRIPAGTLVEADRAMELPGNETVLLVSGSQGEPMSAMSRIAVDMHRDVIVGEGDLVIHSARAIPGNEKSINRLTNHLLRRGARVVGSSEARVHVSGHPSREELKLVLRLLRPRYMIPIHGEYRQLLAHAGLARNLGMEKDRVLLVGTGDIISVNDGECRVTGTVQVGRVFIDAGLEQVDVSMLKDRRRLAGEGIVVAVVAVNRETGKVSRVPEIATRGFVPEEDEDLLRKDAVEVVRRTVTEATSDEKTDEAVLKARIQTDLKRFFRRRAQKRPMIIPVIVEF
jgi:ribonuclease J